MTFQDEMSEVIEALSVSGVREAWFGFIVDQAKGLLSRELNLLDSLDVLIAAWENRDWAIKVPRGLCTDEDEERGER